MDMLLLAPSGHRAFTELPMNFPQWQFYTSGQDHPEELPQRLDEILSIRGVVTVPELIPGGRPQQAVDAGLDVWLWTEDCELILISE
jgi:hypothetical protein